MTVNVDLPIFPIDATLSPAAFGKIVASKMVPVIAALVEPQLPLAAPARSDVVGDQHRRIVGLTPHPAVPPPPQQAMAIARRLEPHLVARYRAEADAALRGTFASAVARMVAKWKGE